MVTLVVACQLPAGVFWPTWETGAVLAPSMSPLITARLSAPFATAGAEAAGPRAIVQRERLSAPSNSSDSVGAQPGTGVEGSPGSPGTSGSVSSDQLVNFAVAFVPLMCET